MLASSMDPDTADALLGGVAVPGFEELAAWLSAIRPDPGGAGEPLERLAVDALTHAGVPVRAAAPSGRRRMAARLLTAKAVAIAGTIAVGGAAAAAATGTLPAPVQAALARGLHHVGITIPATSSSVPGTVLRSARGDGVPLPDAPAGARIDPRRTPGRSEPPPVRAAGHRATPATPAESPARSSRQLCALDEKHRMTASPAARATPGYLPRLEALSGSTSPAHYCATQGSAPGSRAASATAGAARARSNGSAPHDRNTTVGKSAARGEQHAPPAGNSGAHGRTGPPAAHGSRAAAPPNSKSSRSGSHSRAVPHPPAHVPDRADGRISAPSTQSHSTVPSGRSGHRGAG